MVGDGVFYSIDQPRRHHDIGEVARVDGRCLREANTGFQNGVI